MPRQGMFELRTMTTTTALALAIVASSIAAQPLSTERLDAPPLPGFVQGFAKANDQQMIYEEVPTGENVNAWRRMVTTQRFRGLASRMTPVEYAGNILSHVPQTCPTARSSRPSSMVVSGRPAVQFQVECPNSQGGQTETFILLAIAGATDMHVKQVAWRGKISSQSLTWARDFLSKVTLCDPKNICAQ